MSAPAGCPKRMVYGPCGGVRDDGACEMRPGPCAFDDLMPVSVPEIRAGGPPSAHPVPVVLSDFSTPPDDPAFERTAAVQAAAGPAVLVGDHQDRPSGSPVRLAEQLRGAGLRPWITLACRDRNRIALEQELAGLRDAGVDAVLCVTGDGRAYDVRSDVAQVFDLDGPRLAALAAQLGLTVAVPETPTAPPVHLRPRRLVDKQRLGAQVAVLNHVPAASEVGRFVAAARSAGLTVPVLAGVPVYTDAVSAAALQALPGLRLDPAAVAAVLGAPDPVAAGIDTAVAEAGALFALASGPGGSGVAGVNVSGLGSAAGWDAAAEVKAEVTRRVLALVAA